MHMTVKEFATSNNVSTIVVLKTIEDLFQYRAKEMSLVPKNLVKVILKRVVKKQKQKAKSYKASKVKTYDHMDFDKRVYTSDNYGRPFIYVPMGGKVR